MKRISTFLTILLALGLSGCASQPKTEAEQYAELQDQIKYKAYTQVSGKAMKPILKTYNKSREKENKPQVNEDYVHSLVGFIWTLALEPDFAIAECNLALDKSHNNRERYIGLSALSIAFHEKGWKDLAKQTSGQAKNLFDSPKLEKRYRKEKSIAFLVIGSLAIYEGDSILAQDSFSELAEITDKPWLPAVAQGAALFNNGAFSESYRVLKGLSNNQNLSQYERKNIAKLQMKAKQAVNSGDQYGDISSTVSSLLFDAVAEKGDASFHSLVSSIKQYTSDLKI